MRYKVPNKFGFSWDCPDALRTFGKTAVVVALLTTALALVGCGDSSKEQAKVYTVSEQDHSITGDQLVFSRVFVHNCEGCHGANGNDGSAPPINNALFLSLASHDYLYDTIANGRTDHMMPAWLKANGGPLTRAQINKAIRGLKEKWGGPAQDAKGAPQLALHKTSSGKLKGNAKEGEKIYKQVYASGSKKIWLEQMGLGDQAWYLKIVSNQLIRRLLITGRKAFDLPDYKQAGLNSSFGKPLTDEQITDVVAYLAQKRQDVPIAQQE